MKRVGDLLVDEDALDRDAALPGVGEGVQLRLVGRRLPVAVGVDDQRRVGAQLEVDLLVRRPRLRMPQPTSEEPVKVIARVSSCSTIALPTSEPGPGTTLSQPSGSPASSRISASFSAEIGVCPAGLRTTALPAASAGPSLWATRLSGKVERADRADDAVGDPQHHARACRRRPPRPPSAPSRRSACAPRRRRRSASRRSARPRPARSSAACPPRRRSCRASSSTRSPTSSAARSSTAARSCWGKSPGLERLAGRAHGAVDQRRVALGDPADHGLVVGAADLVPLAGLDPLAADEELVVDRLDCLRGQTVLLKWLPGLPIQGSASVDTRFGRTATRAAETC